MLKDDPVRLRHMLDAAQEAMGFVVGRQRADLDKDRQLTLALVKSIEIVGEAAARVSPPARAALPEIPWPSVVGIRNRLIHAYFAVNLDIVWGTIIQDFPPLVAALTSPAMAILIVRNFRPRSTALAQRAKAASTRRLAAASADRNWSRGLVPIVSLAMVNTMPLA